MDACNVLRIVLCVLRIGRVGLAPPFLFLDRINADLPHEIYINSFSSPTKNISRTHETIIYIPA